MIAACSHSISGRLSRKLAIVTMLMLALLFSGAWLSVKMLMKEKNYEELQFRGNVIAQILALELKNGGEQACLSRVRADAPMRANTRLELWRADGQPFYADPSVGSHAMSEHIRSVDFDIEAPQLAGGLLKARYTVDFSADAKFGRNWMVVFVVITLLAGAMVWAGSRWHVRRALRPLNELAAQTRAISARRLDQRLSLADPAEELLPWVEQFNALMQRLEGAVAQLEGFNADVAHELRTPLAALIGHTEVALSRERPAEALRDTLLSNLEEAQRLAALVNDMLFLSQADRGATARRGPTASLAALAAQVVEFHEALIEEAGLTVRIEGDAQAAVDEPLVKRALANLLGNAIRFAQRGSCVAVCIAPDAAEQVRVEVRNAGEPIAPQHLERLFDRFFRVDAARPDSQSHHGLGLAIVAAIARMHAGRPLAASEGGSTRVGFTLVAH
ncbi:heavy metal sensor histidine kinase [Piscinibacter sp.]|uniref:heavy metal sensor histidine kinase n=1 Tax=Piscinibacter sp. TaxID=1903157 RepID=UPI001D779535|nr:heavy metal sensor histidine kinase [Piscinibacter sp.]MBK7532106.1 heavy metal sensor histidine kinase [Piscinibacter sp.]MBL0092757.1 heavy metal sensor histidine kinase [Piscinibacter sp.]HOY35911.1 heavy metal sensor histidine kinase [Piscinibacter sp.]HPG79370.1 heavy metal sensor histidine kinase [Piscinibacter sp.]